MTDPQVSVHGPGTPADFRVLVTGSRDYPAAGRIRAVLIDAITAHPGRTPVLVHGMCDPRHPATRRPIRWTVAKKLRPADQGQLLGADWLADWLATQWGWRVEACPADWQREGRQAGFLRNGRMVRLGADYCPAFIAPCADPRCRRPQAHGSHGASHCADLAEKAGIPVRRYGIS
jgi:hypothetical protein